MVACFNTESLTEERKKMNEVDKEIKELREKFHAEMNKAKLTKSLDQLNESLFSIDEKLSEIEQNPEKYTNLSPSEVFHYAQQARQELTRVCGIASKFAETCKNIYDIAISIYDQQSKNKSS